VQAADADGTRSILDIDHLADSPELGAVTPLAAAALEELFATTFPTRQIIEANMDFFDRIDRGQAVFIIVYEDGRPKELFFAGYSYD
jgi:hypothetical protein